MQYFKPNGDYFVGDCMPFYHEGIFHLYYLLDQGHHRARGGLGGHQWAHASSTDLIHWELHPLAIGIDEEWEGSICTGSTFYHDGMYYGFYATRMPDRTQHLSLATSTDSIHFVKTQPNPFASPPRGYSPRHYRDPFVFRDVKSGEFQMLVTASVEDYGLYDRGGCLLRLRSKDLRQWQPTEPFIIPGGRPGHPSIPECPDYFFWNGWYYLVFGLDWMAHYRMSRDPIGPWIRPPVDSFDGSLAAVMKTAAFKEDRRVGVFFLGSRAGDRDNGERLYAGNAVFREIIQHDDGTLGTKFPPEIVPRAGDALDLSFTALTPGVSRNGRTVRVSALEGLGAGMLEEVPVNARVAATVKPKPKTAEFGICVRGSGRWESGYELRCLPNERRVTLNDQAISCVEGLDRPLKLDVILKDDIVDVCIDERRCLIDRCPELRGERLFFFCQNGQVSFDSVEVRPLL
jgi:hypothetical protein